MFIVTAKEMYDIDKYTIQEIGLSGEMLMENAGREIFRKTLPLVDKTDRIIILVGAGNNGGDGFVIARYLLEENYDIQLVQVAPQEKISGEALVHKQIFLNSGGKVLMMDRIAFDEVIAASDWIIDAVIGIGMKGNVNESTSDVIKAVNESKAKVISVDIPSGLPADEGIAVNVAVEADYTFVVGAIKQSALHPKTSAYYGEWEVVNIGFSKKTMQRYTSRFLYDWNHFATTLPVRKPDSHKGDHGKGLIIGGSASMPGAITMATRAALVAGSGLITTATSKDIIPIIATHSPEAMFQTVMEDNGHLINDNELSFIDYDAVAIGVGMGRNEKTEVLIKRAVEEASCPLILDGDALYHLKNFLPELKERSHPTVITPHAGEMARLVGISIEELLKEPFRYSKKFAEEYGVYVVLKGKFTIITDPNNKQAVETTGNPGLAKGGSGDVLTGIMLAMLMQKQPLFHAICNACLAHGMSADIAVKHKHSVYDLVATDIIDWLHEVYRMIS